MQGQLTKFCLVNTVYKEVSKLILIDFSFSVYILTDDQDIKLGSLEVQPAVQSLLVEQGLFFNNAFVTTPVCCPSRYILVLVTCSFSFHKAGDSCAPRKSFY